MREKQNKTQTKAKAKKEEDSKQFQLKFGNETIFFHQKSFNIAVYYSAGDFIFLFLHLKRPFCLRFCSHFYSVFPIKFAVACDSCHKAATPIYCDTTKTSAR